MRTLPRASLRAIASLAIPLVLLSGGAAAIPLLNGFGGPAGYGPGNVAPNDDGFSSSIPIDSAFMGGLRFFGVVHHAMFVNNNGNITFRAGVYQYTPTPFPIADQPMIAPWWGDVDTRTDGRPGRNWVGWYIEPGRIVATWHNVGYFANHDNRQNDFQLILATSGTCSTSGDFDVEFRYNRCEWTTGDASGGSGGLGGTPAQVGFDAGDRTNYVSLPTSRTARILEVCRSSNVEGGAPGLFHFRIRGGAVAGGCTGAGTPCTVMGQRGACAVGVNICDRAGVRCVQVIMPRPRACNGLDNDCDGMVDDSNDLCPTGQVCDRGNCVDRCRPELGCFMNQTCTDRGTCVETACAMVNCPAGQRCNGGRCSGVCDGFVCPHGQACRGGRCMDPCTGVTCGEREVCIEGACRAACQCEPCAMGFRCQPDGYCVPDACVSMTCPAGQYCEAGTCRDACDHGPDTVMCPPTERCMLGVCEPIPVPVDAGPPDTGVVPYPDSGSVADARSDVRSDTGRDTGRRGDVTVFEGTATVGCACRAGVPWRTPGAAGLLVALAAMLAGRRRGRR